MIHRLRAVFATLVDGFSTRFDLASVEFEDLLARLGVIVALILAGALSAGFALFFLSWAIVEFMPQGDRWLAAFALALLYAGGSWYAYERLCRCLRQMPKPFATTREVLRRDLAALRPTESPIAGEPKPVAHDPVP
ncbi:MAG: phage holin family protein [Opitutales bacterium]